MQPTKIPGRPWLEFRLLQESDYGNLEIFCNECKKLNLKNNESFDAIKIDKMKMPYGQYFIGYDYNSERIWNLAGIHRLPEINDRAWRCLFRGAQLPGYTMQHILTKNMLKTSYQMTFVLHWQIEFIKSMYKDAEFYTSTNNLKNKDAPIKSQLLDQKVNPLLENQGIFEKVHDNFLLYNTSQSIWKVHHNVLIQERNKVLETMNLF